MSKRSRFPRRSGLPDQRPEAGNDPPPQGGKTRRVLWAAALVLATAALSVAAVLAVVSYRSLAASPVTGSTDDPRAKEVEELIRRYFRTWSNQDMKGYGACFLEDSTIQYIDADDQLKPSDLHSFVAHQGELLRTGQKETEVPESIDIRFEAKLAHVVVYWKLTVGQKRPSATTTSPC